MDEKNGIPNILNISKLPSLDGLRGLSIVFVILAHFFYTTSFDNYNVGVIGVEVFFVISGFLITTLLLKEKVLNKKIDLKKFYIRRSLRILPVIMLFLFVLFFLNLIFKLGINKLSFVTAILFIKNLPIPNGSDWYTGHFWSLGIEEQFYLIFPFLISYFSLKNYKIIVVTLIILLTTLSFLFFGKVDIFYSNRIIHKVTMIIVDCFGGGTSLILIGSYLSTLMFDDSIFIKKIESIRIYPFSLILFITALIFRVPTIGLYIPYFSDSLFGFLIGIIIIINLRPDNLMAKFLNAKYIAQLGILSYSLYIWQQIFTYKQPWANLFQYANSKIINLFGLLIVGCLSYFLYERKFLNFKKRFKNVE